MQAAPEVIRWTTKVVPYLSGRLTWAKNDYKRVTEERAGSPTNSLNTTKNY